MDYLNMLVAMNIMDVREAILAIEEGNPHVALEILKETEEAYELEGELNDTD